MNPSTNQISLKDAFLKLWEAGGVVIGLDRSPKR
jgi:hypothetical protein